MLNSSSSLYARLSLVLLTSIILSLFISNSLWWFFISQEENKNSRDEMKYLAEEVQEYVYQFNNLSQQQRLPILKTLNRIGDNNYAFGNIYFLSLDENINTVKPANDINDDIIFLSKLLNRSLNTPVKTIAIKVDHLPENNAEFDSIEEEHFLSDDYYPETLLEKLLLIEENETDIAIVIQAQLDDSQWLTLYTTPLSDRTHLADILSPLNIIIIACSLPLILGFLFMAVRWLNAPLSRLAEKAEGIGKDILLKQKISKGGPLEIQKIETALSIMQDRIIEQIEHSNDVFSAMSHDLKTPLTRMRIRAEMLNDIKIKDKFISDIDRLEKMITGALNYIKHTENREQKNQIDMNALLQSIADDTNDLGGEVIVDGICQSYFFGYPIALRSCFANLIENAIFYGNKATVKLLESDSKLTITILDNGPGIPEKDLQNVLIPYYRVDESRNLNTGGSGLGLSIANKAIQAHLGKIVIKNRVGKKGLSVEVTLPFSK